MARMQIPIKVPKNDHKQTRHCGSCFGLSYRLPRNCKMMRGTRIAAYHLKVEKRNRDNEDSSHCPPILMYFPFENPCIYPTTMLTLFHYAIYLPSCYSLLHTCCLYFIMSHANHHHTHMSPLTVGDLTRIHSTL